MIGERLREIRKEKKLSQKALAELLSTSSGYISEIEQGKTIPGGKFLSSLNRAIGISIDWLLTGVGNPFLPEPDSLKDDYSRTDVFQNIEDKNYVIEIENDLGELEKENPIAFRKVGPYIKGLLDATNPTPIQSSVNNEYTGLKRRTSQRRLKDDPEKIPGGKDRRSGKDRRAGVTR